MNEPMKVYRFKRDQGANSFERFVAVDESHPQTTVETAVCRDATRISGTDRWAFGHTLLVDRRELFPLA